MKLILKSCFYLSFDERRRARTWVAMGRREGLFVFQLCCFRFFFFGVRSSRNSILPAGFYRALFRREAISAHKTPKTVFVRFRTTTTTVMMGRVVILIVEETRKNRNVQWNSKTSDTQAEFLGWDSSFTLEGEAQLRGMLTGPRTSLCH